MIPSRSLLVVHTYAQRFDIYDLQKLSIVQVVSSPCPPGQNVCLPVTALDADKFLLGSVSGDVRIVDSSGQVLQTLCCQGMSRTTSYIGSRS